MSMVEFTGGVAEVAVVRSVLVGGQGPLIISTTTATGGERKLHVQRSVLASRGPFLELTSPVGSRPTPVTVRALASTFARFRTEEPASLIFFHDDVGGEAKDFVNWQGEQNVFMGWNDWASMGNGHVVKVADAGRRPHGLARDRRAEPGAARRLAGPPRFQPGASGADEDARAAIAGDAAGCDAPVGLHL